MSTALLAMIKGAKSKFSRTNNRVVKPKEGKTQYRILQVNPEDKFYEELGVHWIKTEKGGKPVAVVGCFDVVHDQPCPICNAYEKAMKAAPDDETKEIVKEWRVKKSVLVQALVRTGPDASETDPVILELGATLFGDICSMAEEYLPDYGNMFDVAKGFDVVIERKGKMLDTSYNALPKFGTKPVSKDAIGKMVNLKEFIEREYFKGEERKALNAIVGMTGISVPSIGGATSAGLLTRPSARLPEPEPEAPLIEEPEVDELPEIPPAAPKPENPGPTDAQKAAVAPKASTAKPALKPAPEPEKAADGFGDELEKEDLDALLGELDGLSA